MDYKQKSKQIRKDILEMIHNAKSGHTGGSLSCVEILLSLYYGCMNVDPKNPEYEDRDRFIMSKGHSCPALYAVLVDKGYFDKSELSKFRKIDGHLQGHPDFRKVKGVDMNTGSLGQGASLAFGLALCAKHKKRDYKIYALLGDGECQEGIVWEAAMAASHYKLDNLVFILDHNGLQIDGSNDEVLSIGDITSKFKSFGFETFDVDGHNVDELINALKADTNNKPKFINAKTVKGKGISFMENNYKWHGKAPNDEELADALKCLEV